MIIFNQPGRRHLTHFGAAAQLVLYTKRNRVNEGPHLGHMLLYESASILSSINLHHPKLQYYKDEAELH